MNFSRRYPPTINSPFGFTLVELLVVITMSGILAALIAPTWQGLIETQRLNTSIERVYYAMQAAKTNAKRDKITWQVSFRETSIQGTAIAQWAVHPAIPSNANIDVNQLPWQSFPSNIRIVDTFYGDNNETTLDDYRLRNSPEPLLRIQFNYHGNTNGRFGCLTLANRNSNPDNPRRQLRCVIVSTLIGTLRTSYNQRDQDDNGRYCH